MERSHLNNTIGNIINRWHRTFENKDISEPMTSIEHIVAHVIGTKKIDVVNHQKRELTLKEIEKLEILCHFRLTGMPVQYIIGEWKFRDITLKVVPKVFIPEPQTELLVDFALKRINAHNFEKPCDILEIGCGSGAISLSLLHSCKKLNIFSIDTNPQACALTLKNAENLKLQDRITVILATLQQDGTIQVSSERNVPDFNNKKFDFIVSNPPYEPAKLVYKALAENKLFADVRATDGGDDGMKIIKPLLNYTANALKPAGRLFMEIDPVNDENIQLFITKQKNLKLKFERTYKDLRNTNRFVEISKLY